MDVHIPKGKLIPYRTTGENGGGCLLGHMQKQGLTNALVGRSIRLLCSLNNGFWGIAVPGSDLPSEIMSQHLNDNDANWSDETRIRYITVMKNAFNLNIIFDGWDDPREKVDITDLISAEVETAELVAV